MMNHLEKLDFLFVNLWCADILNTNIKELVNHALQIYTVTAIPVRPSLLRSRKRG